MFSSTQPQSAPRRSLAATALRGAGLTDGDAKMGEDRPQAGSSGSSSAHARSKDRLRQRVYERPQFLEKDKAGKTLQPLAARLMAGKGSTLSIRGAASGSKSVTPPLRGPRRDGGLEQWAKDREKGKPSADPQARKSNVTLLKGFIAERYDAQRKFLNLEKLAEDPFWKKNAIAPLDSLEAAKDLGPVMLKLAGQLQPPVETLSLAHNQFRTLRPLTYMAHYLPTVINLSLQDNRIGSSKEITWLLSKNGAASKLQELIFLDNPFRTSAEKNDNLSSYRAEITRHFPDLEMLDMTAVTKIGFDVTPLKKLDPKVPDLAAEKEFAVEMGPAVLPDNIKDLATAFLASFFPKFDHARSSLIDAYAPNATFSYSINTKVPTRARIKGYHRSTAMPHQVELTWDEWQMTSRNLTRVTNITKTANLLSSTAEEVVKAFEHLPQTMHEIAEGPEKFLVDAWAVDGVVPAEMSPPSGTALFATVHGQFTELPTKGIRSFDRTFILVPSVEGSKARLAGWQFVILSDQLVVRNYSSPEAWAPGPLKVQIPEPGDAGPSARPVNGQQLPLPPRPQPAVRQLPAAPPIQPQQPLPAPSQPSTLVNQPNLNQELLATLPELQRNVTIQLQMQTGLNTQFAGECLNANGWDLMQALANFEQLRVTIPPAAFQ